LSLRSIFLNDAASFGSSTLRLGRATRDEFRTQIDRILSTGRTKADGTPREVIGFVRISAAMVRALRTDKDKDQKPLVVQMCGIYATGLDDAPNHADLALNAVERLSNGGRLRAVKTLGSAVCDAFQAVSSVEEIIALGTA
jgi:hypothetical protein